MISALAIGLATLVVTGTIIAAIPAGVAFAIVAYRSPARRRAWLMASLVSFAAPFAIANALGNLWLMLTELDSYVVPKRSSVFTFTPTVMNDGNGGWWVYGKDFSNYYWFADGYAGEYVYFPKKDVGSCAEFNPVDHVTWCRKLRDLPVKDRRVRAL
jgi:hypothetical protein